MAKGVEQAQGSVERTDLAELERRALAELTGSADEAALRAWKTRFLDGEVARALKGEPPRSPVNPEVLAR